MSNCSTRFKYLSVESAPKRNSPFFDSAIRWYVSMDTLFHRQSDAGVQETEGGFRTQVFTALDPADIDFADVRAELDSEVERFTNVGSGWNFTAILRFVVRIGQYRPLVGSSFIPTPASLMPKQALIKVYNPNDSACALPGPSFLPYILPVNTPK
jgi:hypothetical protein